jgi:uncharacterized protein (DUF1499 family)
MGIGLLGLLGCAGKPPVNLGIHDGRLAACPSSPNCVASQSADEGHRVAPFTFSGDADAAFSRLKRVVGLRKDAKIVEEQAGYLRFELSTTLFVDDAEFQLDREKKVIQVRSASRLGYSDLGKNRSRMEEIRREFVSSEATP